MAAPIVPYTRTPPPADPESSALHLDSNLTSLERTTASLIAASATKAPLDSPALTGAPTAPTAATGTNTSQVATTAFVHQAAADAVTASAVPVNGIDNAHLAQMPTGTIKSNIIGDTANAADNTLTAVRDAMGVKPGVNVEILGAVASVNTQTGTAYTLALSDIGKLIETSNAAANTLTIPPNSSVALPVGTIFNVTQAGAGQTTVTAGAGVTIRQRQTKLNLAGQWAMVTIYQRAANEWVLGGDLST